MRFIPFVFLGAGLAACSTPERLPCIDGSCLGLATNDGGTSFDGGALDAGLTDAGVDAGAPGDGGYVTPADYPRGPYGNAVSSTIANLEVFGRHDASLKGDPAYSVSGSDPNISTYPAQTLHLADYRPNVRVLVLHLSSQWDPHSMNEQADLKSQYVGWNQTTAQVGVLEVLLQNTSGDPATSANADQWARAYGLNFDIAVDPSNTLSTDLGLSAFPTNFVIRTSDMQIVWAQAGDNSTGLVNAVQFVLNSRTP